MQGTRRSEEQIVGPEFRGRALAARMRSRRLRRCLLLRASSPMKPKFNRGLEHVEWQRGLGLSSGAVVWHLEASSRVSKPTTATRYLAESFTHRESHAAL